MHAVPALVRRPTDADPERGFLALIANGVLRLCARGPSEPGPDLLRS